MSRIRLNDILNLTEEEISRTKFRFMTQSGDGNFNPNKIVEDKEERDKINHEALVWNGKKIYFRENNIAIGFIPLGNDKWLMTGAMNVSHDNGYSEPAEAKYYGRLEKYNFRIVVKFHKYFELGVIYATTELPSKDTSGIEMPKRLIDMLEVHEIRNPEKLDEKVFPGYHNFLLNYNDLKNILRASNEWFFRLKSVKGVYVISDKKTGKLYVGSAYGEDGIYGRWRTYMESGYDKKEVENGKYPNREFQKLVNENGLDYIKENFQYSILETFTLETDDEYIINRESHWKDVLLTREFGYNAN